MKLINSILVTGLSLFLFSSCEKDKGPYFVELTPIEDTVVQPPPVTPPTEFAYTISYNNDVKTMFAANCVQQCHNPSHPKLDLRPSVSYDQLLFDGLSAPYVDTINPQQSSLYLHLAGVYTQMPLDTTPLSQGKIDTVYTWISQGAQNN